MKSRLPLQRLACLLLCLTVAMTAACGSKRTVPTREGESPEWMGTIRDLRTFPQDLTPFARWAGGSTPLLSEQEQQIQDARFNRIFFAYMYPDGMTADAIEDHVWMDGADFASFAVGDSVSFYAEVYRYLKTGNGKQLAFGLRSPCGIRRCAPYALPSEKELRAQRMELSCCDNCYLGDCCSRVSCMLNRR